MNVFIRIDNQIDFRRNSLEAGRSAVLAQKTCNEIEIIRKNKRARLNELKRIIGRINKLNVELDKTFPLQNLKELGIKIESNIISRKPVEIPTEEDKNEVKEEEVQTPTPKNDKLDFQLAELEARLRGM